MRIRNVIWVILILLAPARVFSQWMVLDTLCPYDPYGWPKYSCYDWYMTKPDVGYLAYHLTEFWQTPHFAEVGVRKMGSSQLFFGECSDGGSVSLAISDLRFINDTVGYFNVSGSIGCEVAMVYRTTNGHDFSAINIPQPELSVFTPAGTAYVLHRHQSFFMDGYLSRYRNGVIDQLKSFPGNPTFHVICFLNDSVGFYSVDHSFQRTSDRGQTWIPIDTVTGRVNAICFPTPMVGYLVKNDTSLYKTTDGGNHWMFIGKEPKLNSIDFLTDSIGYAVGDGGLILYTEDGAESWVVQPCPTTGRLIRVQFVTPSVGFIYKKDAAWNAPNIRLRTIRDGSPDLSMVSYDSVSGKNKIFWNKEVNLPNRFSPVTHFNIYRKDTSGVKTKIGTCAYNQPGEFTDMSSLPAQKAEVYTLTSVDSSGYESPFSPPQQTMFLEVENAGDTASKLKWTPWTGPSLTGYLVFRKFLDGAWIRLDSVGPATGSYALPGLTDKKASYLIQAAVDTSKVAQNQTIRFPISNMVMVSPNGVSDDEMLSFRIVPNPGHDRITIEIPPSIANGLLTMVSSMGVEIMRFIISGNNVAVDIGDLKPGIYLVVLESKRVVTALKFVRE